MILHQIKWLSKISFKKLPTEIEQRNAHVTVYIVLMKVWIPLQIEDVEIKMNEENAQRG